jgi:hypothetical protein
MPLHEAWLGAFVSMHNACPADFASSLFPPFLSWFPIYSLYMPMPFCGYIAESIDKDHLVWLLDQNQYCWEGHPGLTLFLFHDHEHCLIVDFSPIEIGKRYFSVCLKYRKVHICAGYRYIGFDHRFDNDAQQHVHFGSICRLELGIDLLEYIPLTQASEI